MKGKPALPKHRFILKSFLENPILKLTINDLVIKVRKHRYFETNKACLWDKADISHERSDLVSFKIIEIDGYAKRGAPYYRLVDIKRAMALIDGAKF